MVMKVRDIVWQAYLDANNAYEQAYVESEEACDKALKVRAEALKVRDDAWESYKAFGKVDKY